MKLKMVEYDYPLPKRPQLQRQESILADLLVAQGVKSGIHLSSVFYSPLTDRI